MRVTLLYFYYSSFLCSANSRPKTSAFFWSGIGEIWRVAAWKGDFFTDGRHVKYNSVVALAQG